METLKAGIKSIDLIERESSVKKRIKRDKPEGINSRLRPRVVRRKLGR